MIIMTMTKAQARKRLEEAEKKIDLVFVDYYSMTSNDYIKLKDLFRKNILKLRK